MDVQRNDRKKRKRTKLIRVAALIIIILVIGAFALTRLGPAIPNVDRQTVWIDTVKQGPLELAVRGIGTLQPVEVRWLTARTEGRVEQRLQLPGAIVEPGTIIIQLSNPELQQSLKNAELELRAAEADFANLQAELENRLLEQKSLLARTQASSESAQLEAEVNQELFDEGLVARLTMKQSELSAKQYVIQLELEEQRLESIKNSIEKQLAARQVSVEQERERFNLIKSQVEGLTIRSHMNGVLQRLPVEEGQQVNAGQNLAQVSDPTQLKAVVRVPQTQARDVMLGQNAEIDTRNGVVLGSVIRVSPTVENGTVDVEIALSSELPKGARADLSVEGSIKLAELDNVTYVGRPAFGRENSTVAMFKLDPASSQASRISVSFGHSSITEIEIREGLRAGEQVILSDTSEWDEYDVIQLR